LRKVKNNTESKEGNNSGPQSIEFTLERGEWKNGRHEWARRAPDRHSPFWFRHFPMPQLEQRASQQSS
jgi:hypothetical protein